MDADKYQKSCMRTAKELESPHDLLMPAIGLGGEAAEVLELLEEVGIEFLKPSLNVRVGKALERIKKHAYHGKTLNVGELAKELGDVLWYLAVLADAAGLSLSTVMERNVEKLNERYPAKGVGRVSYLRSKLPQERKRLPPRKPRARPRKRK
jgi:NTP pyrophosphatase (non-canonical NTP hydrolase)